jgi:hypothetical protein
VTLPQYVQVADSRRHVGFCARLTFEERRAPVAQKLEDGGDHVALAVKILGSGQLRGKPASDAGPRGSLLGAKVRVESASPLTKKERHLLPEPESTCRNVRSRGYPSQP